MKLFPVLASCLLVLGLVGSLSTHPTLLHLLWWNAAVQLVWFTLVAGLPTWRTGRMSWVDIAWPFGVALVGLFALLGGDGLEVRRIAVGAVYLFIGLRMGLGALGMARLTGVIFRTEFPRYQYARMRMLESGVTDPRPHMVVEVMTQGVANASVLALPAFLLATNPSPDLSPWEWTGLGIWLVAYLVESTADAQKLLFVSRDDGKGVCDVGLWRYSRHPNYFAEWLVWTGLVIAAAPSWWALRDQEAPVVWGAMGLGLLGASALMYTTLVYLTGAIPAEHFSVQKRPAYRDYQARTNRFFPWFPKA